MSKISDLDILVEMLNTLISNKEITDLVEDKIYPILIAKDTKADSVYYGSYGLKSDNNKMGVSGYSMHVCYSVVSDVYERMNIISWLIIDSLAGTYNNPYMDIRVVDSEEDSEDLKYVKTIDFLVEW